ncbi:helix-turn-helix domain-containing protein [Piscibacillus sp. B03]|uniref:helix-turn-helix domain-containing protein n=1 Tax=Piscibacillus sp. B03 TaxID=3457430 RepID=UPI003FCC9C72
MKVRVKDPKKLELLAITKGFNKTSLSKRANIHPVTGWKVMRGENNPSPATALKICKALNVEFDEIFAVEDEEGVIS